MYWLDNHGSESIQYNMACDISLPIEYSNPSGVHSFKLP